MWLVRTHSRSSSRASADSKSVDSLNPIDLCNKLNQVRFSTLTSLPSVPNDSDLLDLPQFVLPEMIAHAFMTTTFLLSFQVIAFLLNAPLLAYNVNK